MRKLIITILFLFASTNAQELVDGEKLGNIQIGKSTIYDVIGLYGQDYKLKKNTDYSNVLVYEKLGLSFYSCQADSEQEIFVVVMQPPFVVKTQRGITLGKSTFQDLFKKYGRWSETSAGFEYEEIGLYFDHQIESWYDFEDDKFNFAQRKSGDGKFSAIEKVEGSSEVLQDNKVLQDDKVENNALNTNNNRLNSDVNQTNSLNANSQFSVESNSINNSSNNRLNKPKNKSEEDLFLDSFKKVKKKVVTHIELIEKGGLRQCENLGSEN
jgi:hypothetical protein